MITAQEKPDAGTISWRIVHSAMSINRATRWKEEVGWEEISGG